MNRMRQFPGQEKMVIDYYRKNPGAMMELRGPIFEQKVVDSIVAKAKVNDKTVSKDELQAMVQDEDEIPSEA
jgi:trigger factor